MTHMTCIRCSSPGAGGCQDLMDWQLPPCRRSHHEQHLPLSLVCLDTRFQNDDDNPGGMDIPKGDDNAGGVDMA